LTFNVLSRERSKLDFKDCKNLSACPGMTEYPSQWFFKYLGCANDVL